MNLMASPASGAPGRNRLGSQLEAFYSFAGKTPSRPEVVRLIFTAFGAEMYKTKTDFTIKAEGELLFEGKAEHRPIRMKVTTDTSTGMRTRGESLTLAVPTDTFVRVANARKVHIKIGPTGYDLNEKQRQSLKALAASIDKCEQPDCLWGTLDKR